MAKTTGATGGGGGVGLGTILGVLSDNLPARRLPPRLRLPLTTFLSGFASGHLVYWCWKTRVNGLWSGLATLTIMVPSAARV